MLKDENGSLLLKVCNDEKVKNALENFPFQATSDDFFELGNLITSITKEMGEEKVEVVVNHEEIIVKREVVLIVSIKIGRTFSTRQERIFLKIERS